MGTLCGTPRPCLPPAPRSVPAGDTKPELIVKVEPEEESSMGCPHGLGDPGAPGHHVGTGGSAAGPGSLSSQKPSHRLREGSEHLWASLVAIPSPAVPCHQLQNRPPGSKSLGSPRPSSSSSPGNPSTAAPAAPVLVPPGPGALEVPLVAAKGPLGWTGGSFCSSDLGGGIARGTFGCAGTWRWVGGRGGTQLGAEDRVASPSSSITQHAGTR